jgi:hypothetical protein
MRCVRRQDSDWKPEDNGAWWWRMRNFGRFNRDNTKYGKRHVPGQMNQTEGSE